MSKKYNITDNDILSAFETVIRSGGNIVTSEYQPGKNPAPFALFACNNHFRLMHVVRVFNENKIYLQEIYDKVNGILVNFEQLNGEQKIDAVTKIANIENKTEDVIRKELIQDWDADEYYTFRIIDDNEIEVQTI